MQSAPGTSKITVSIPLYQPGSQFKFAPASRSGANAASAKPAFIDAYSNGSIYGYLDGQLAMTLNFGTCITWDSTTGTIPTLIAGCMDSTTPISGTGGSTISYTSAITTGSTLNVTVTLTTVVGVLHTFGIVETNGACLKNQESEYSCIPYGGNPGLNLGYVLAEGQTSFTPTAGPNDAIILTLGGVLEAGYLCATSDPTCSVLPGPVGTDGWYHMVAFPTDENGNPVIPYTGVVPDTGVVPGWKTPYDNGAWQIVVTSGQSVVSVLPDNANPIGSNPLNNLGPFTIANPYKISGNWWDGEGFKFQCLTTGTATIAMKMVDTSLAKGNVVGFSYSNLNYPATGALLGAIGSDPVNFGNGEGITIGCSGTEVITVR
jgi:hypothetical protein